jgi:hypothetical protein
MKEPRRIIANSCPSFRRTRCGAYGEQDIIVRYQRERASTLPALVVDRADRKRLVLQAGSSPTAHTGEAHAEQIATFEALHARARCGADEATRGIGARPRERVAREGRRRPGENRNDARTISTSGSTASRAPT